MRPRAMVLASAVVLVLAGCGGDDDDSADAPPATTAAPSAVDTTASDPANVEAAEWRAKLAKGAAAANEYCTQHFEQIAEGGSDPPAVVARGKEQFVEDAIAAAQAVPELKLDVLTLALKRELKNQPLRRFLVEWARALRMGGKDVACDPAGADRLTQAAQGLPG